MIREWLRKHLLECDGKFYTHCFHDNRVAQRTVADCKVLRTVDIQKCCRCGWERACYGYPRDIIPHESGV